MASTRGRKYRTCLRLTDPRRCLENWRKHVSRTFKTRRSCRVNGLVLLMGNSSWKMASQRSGIVVNATSLSLSAACFKCTSVQGIQTGLTNVAIARRSLRIQTSCARMLSFILGKNHSSADFAHVLSPEQQLLTIMSEHTLEKGLLPATSATKHFHKHRSSASTRDLFTNVSPETSIDS